MHTSVSKLAAKVLVPLLAAGAGSCLAADVKERTIKYPIVYEMTHPHGLGAQKFSDLVSDRSGGKLKVRVYPNATLGGEVQVLSAMQGGTVEMSAIATSQLIGNIKDFTVMDLPFLFGSEREADLVMDGPVGKQLLDRLPAKGLVGLGWFEHGFRNLTNSRRAVSKLEDLAGLKIRVTQNAVAIDTFNALGANAVPLSFTELYTALEQKAVDGQENPYAGIENAKMYEVQKFLSITKHSYTPLVLMASKKFWDTLSADEKMILESAAVEAAVYQRAANREVNEKALQALKSAGMQVTAISPEEMERIRVKVEPVIKRHAQQVSEPLMKEVYSELKKLR